MKFACNISTMFNNLPMVERYSAAAKLGFKAVECQFLQSESPNELAAAMRRAKVEHVLLNSSPGEEGDFGFAAIPGREVEFVNSINKMLSFTFALGCKKMHILSGMMPENVTDLEYLDQLYISNFQNVAEMLEEHNIVGLIEPLCPKVKKNYFLSSFVKAIDLLEEIDRPNIKLLLDVYHLYEIEGSMENLENYYKYAGHVQVSQSPDRTELNAPGNIDYKDVLKRLDALQKDEFVGLEYFPTGSVEESLKWMQEYGYTL